jgi:DNA-directed RNA polymerase subunit D
METVFKAIQRPRAHTIAFRLAPTHVAYANTLRRLCMTSVENIGFRADIAEDGSTTDVQILANSTPMTNEMLAHRVGLLPIHVKDPASWDPARYEFVLDKVNDTDEAMDIFASHFRVMERQGDEMMALSPQATLGFFHPHPETQDTCLLATLKPLLPGGKPEEIRIKAKATIGVGRENARFIPTSQCAYSYTRDTDPIHEKEAFDKWLLSSKKIDPAILETDPVKKAPLDREFKTLQINRCYLTDETGEPYSFDFTIESVGVLDPEAIVLRGCQAGAELCKRYVDPNLPADVVVQPVEGRLVGWDFYFQKQDHTLGHLVQAWLDQNMVGNGEITFAGYDIPHPLRDEMLIRIGVKNGEEATARRAIGTAMSALAAMFESWAQQWSSATMPAAGIAASPAVAAITPTLRRIVRRPTAATAQPSSGAAM